MKQQENDDDFEDYIRIIEKYSLVEFQIKKVGWKSKTTSVLQWELIHTITTRFKLDPEIIETVKSAIKHDPRYFISCAQCGKKKPSGFFLNIDICPICSAVNRIIFLRAGV